MALMTTSSRPRTTMRRVAALLSLVVSATYLVVFLQLLRTFGELPDDPTPAFEFLAGVYLVGAIVTLVFDNRGLQWLGAAVQVALLAGYVGITVLKEQEFARRFLVQGVLISVAQVALLAVLVALALGRGMEDAGSA
ncbi:hypothetical protein BCR15_12565 [Tessaracoccus lapidicaptus]|uniref:Uncharacterized protein n=1 Tax=Tessaracoccus lapidicaptus TaxID=1427523 RepID=A0A1C0ARH8_9ACTN|nr:MULTISPECIES: hypothetical protein [Tessaracoccus]AQX16216.1 hypothetical protein BKM78_10060 [Tessaracoccus sp. T2.5-30]OCL36913.1 hypothetical protein BCR15_12565 [Tessaracoccus lapidicaptus]VEP40799.1 hypothetical protein TLA_TLA_02029 [Tessaracoccus lapidicaptus]